MTKQQIRDLIDGQIKNIRTQLELKGFSLISHVITDQGLIGCMFTIEVDRPADLQGMYADLLSVSITSDDSEAEILVEIEALTAAATRPIDPRIAEIVPDSDDLMAIINGLPGTGLIDVLSMVELAGMTHSDFFALVQRAQSDPQVHNQLLQFLGQNPADVAAFFKQDRNRTSGFGKKSKKNHH